MKVNVILKALLSFAIIFFGSTDLFATPQIRDILIYEGKEYPIEQEYLEDYFEKFPNRNPKDENNPCSALWRGYQATFEVSDGTIYLKDVRTNVCFGDSKSELKKVVPDGGPLKLDWVTGLIRSGYGKNDADAYSLEYFETYENYAFFLADNGRIIEVRHFDNKGYKAFKQNQFEAYKKTPEYDVTVREMLARHPDMDARWAADNILSEIFSYTKTFLDK